MSKGRVLKMALDEIVGGVKKVDLGDLTKKINVGDRVEAIKRMLGDAGEKVVEKADDALRAASRVAEPKPVGRKNKRLSELWDEDVYELDPKQFTSTYKVGWPYEEAKTWDELSELDDYWEGPLIRHDPDDIDASDIAAMTDDIQKRGIQTPVRVSRETGQILDGHHRVMAARDTGRKIPFVLV